MTNATPRLAHVITTPQDRFASGLRTRLEARICRDLGFQVDVVTGWGITDQGLTDAPLPGVGYHRLPSLVKYLSPRRDLQALAHLYRLFRRRRYDVVQTHLSKAGVLGRIAAGLAGVPAVVHEVHGYGFPPQHARPLQAFYLTLERLAGRFTTHFIFYGRHLQETYQIQRIGPAAAQHVILPGVDFSAFLEAPPLTAEARAQQRAAWGLTPDDLVLGYVARVVPSKGQQFAIQALYALQDTHPRAKLLLVGGAIWPAEKKYLERLHLLAKDLGLAEKVVCAGHQRRVAPFYQLFDVYVAPSLYEGAPLTVTEALLMDLPVVAFDIPAMREFYADQAILTPLGDAAGLSRGVIRALNGGAGVRDQAFRDRVVEQFSLAGWRQRLAAFYRGVCPRLPEPLRS